jgi:hypothetical protein
MTTKETLHAMRDTMNKTLALILLAGIDEGIDGYVYAASMTHGADLETFRLCKELALSQGWIRRSGAHTFQNTDAGNAIAKEIKISFTVQ